MFEDEPMTTITNLLSRLNDAWNTWQRRAAYHPERRYMRGRTPNVGH